MQVSAIRVVHYLLDEQNQCLVVTEVIRNLKIGFKFDDSNLPLRMTQSS